MNAPACPTSSSQLPYGRQWQALVLDHHTNDLIHSIPRATDLPSAIRALNIINNVVMQITHNAPQINNTYVEGMPSVRLKGDDPDPHFQKADWIEESRVYQTQKLINHDDPDQFIELKILQHVGFGNINTGFKIFYEGPFL
jgi:hypothetical protein